MNTYSEMRNLRLLEAFLTDLICHAKTPNEIDLLTQALVSLQLLLTQLERQKGMVA
jgi:hypothetical protein